MNKLTSRYWIISLLFISYLLVYTPAPQSIDGADTLDVAISLVRYQSLAAPHLTTERQLIVANALGEEQYLLSEDGERYSKKGITPSLLLVPFVFIAELVPALSTRAMAMLFNPLVTMLTAVLLFQFAQDLGASLRHSTAIALLYGLGTFSLAYVKTLFGEPLAALLLLQSLYAAYCYRQSQQKCYLILSSTTLALTIGINLTYLLFYPLMGLYIIRKRWDFTPIIYFVIPLLLMLALLGGFNWMRFGSLLESGYYLNDVEGFTTPLWYGFIGNWLSLYKGIFWFSPIMFLAPLGWFRLRQRDTVLAWLILALVIVQSCVYGMWWAWDGAWSWGPRFLLPVLPIMMLAILPMLERMSKQRDLNILLLALSALSVWVQVPVFVDGIDYFYRNYFDGRLFSLKNNIIGVLFRHLPLPSDTALLQEGLDSVHLLVIIMSIALCCFSMWLIKSDRLKASMIIIILALASCIVVYRQQQKEHYQLVREMTQTFKPAGTVFIASFRFDTRTMDVNNGSRFIVTNPHAPQDNPRIQAQFQQALQRNDDFYLVHWFAPTAPENWFARYLWQNAAFIAYDSVNEHQVLHFDTLDKADINTVGAWQFGNIDLARYGQKRTNRGLYVSLEWQANQPMTQDYTWFVHLVGADGQILQQQDRPPQGGYHPTSTWQEDELVRDFILFPLAPEDSLDGAFLRIGFIDPATGERLPTLAPDAQALADNFIIIPLS